MKNRGARVVLVAAALVASLAARLPAQSCAHCGTERWAVKTLSDGDRLKVRSTPVATTIGALGSLAMPHHRPDDARIAPTELTTFRIRAVIVGWKGESDQDFHLVVADRGNPLETMIIEVPSPGCTGVCTSGKVRDMARARQTVLDHLGRVPNGRLACLDPEPKVTVTGVGFFDRPHNQNGRAPNAIELHPVLEISFDDPDVRPQHVSCRTGAPIKRRVRAAPAPRVRTPLMPRGDTSAGRDSAVTPLDSVPLGASARCRDGTYSFSRHRRGTCSYHGGVAEWVGLKR